MSTKTTDQILAEEYRNGAYPLNVLDNCDTILPKDRNPHVVKYSQLMVFAEPKGAQAKEPNYLIVQPHLLFKGGTSSNSEGTIQNTIKPLAKKILEDLQIDYVPKPDSKDINSIREFIKGRTGELESQTFSKRLTNTKSKISETLKETDKVINRHIGNLPKLDISDDEIRTKYKEWYNTLTKNSLHKRFAHWLENRLVDNSFLAKGKIDEKDIEDVLTQLFLPEKFQPFRSDHPHLALHAIYDQLWEPVGYSRGELLNTISLAPGEQLTLEMHFWDKATFKSEEEIQKEQEFRTSEKLSQRDTFTTAHEVSRKENSNMNFSLTVPIAEVPINFGGASITTDVTTNVKNASEKIRDRSTEASQTLKLNRKQRIEISREIGREEKQTRKIENTNRCHTLNCHYFEVMSNYILTTKLSSIQPCVLLQIPKFEITPKWVSCHAHILKEVMIDKSFLHGFDAADVLEVNSTLQAMRQRQRRSLDEMTDEEIKEDLTPIIDAYTILYEAAKRINDVAKVLEPQNLSPNMFGAIMYGYVEPDDFPRLLYIGSLTQRVRNTLREVWAYSHVSRYAMEILYRNINSTEFFPTPRFPTIGFDVRDVQISEYTVQTLQAWGIGRYSPKDEGLYTAINNAYEKITGNLITSTEETDSQVDSNLEIAKATVSYERLKCHIEDNILHYSQAILLREDRNQRFLRLQSYGLISRIIKNEIVGFLGDKAAYPIYNWEDVKHLLDMDKIEQEINSTNNSNTSTLITLPTPGTILEAMVGKCDACEDYIEKSRLLDLRSQEAKMLQEEFEAERRKLRIQSSPPDLSPFVPAPDENAG